MLRRIAAWAALARRSNRGSIVDVYCAPQAVRRCWSLSFQISPASPSPRAAQIQAVAGFLGPGHPSSHLNVGQTLLMLRKIVIHDTKNKQMLQLES